MEQKIIEDYVKNKCSLEYIAKKYNMGKIKIKQILTSNNIELNKKGGQKKYINNLTLESTDFRLKCKKCDKIFNDYQNKSGVITKHITDCFSENIPTSFKRRMFVKQYGYPWHLKYFDKLDPIENKTKHCPICDWETTDLTNKTGSLTKHIEGKHNLSISDFLEIYPNYMDMFNTTMSLKNREETFNNEDNYVICNICGDKLKILSNTHLIKHNITQEEYKVKYGEDSIISINTKDLFIDNIMNVDSIPTYRSNAEKEIEEFLIENKINISCNDKKILGGTELDFYLPDHNIAIEYNGLYWHSEKQGKIKTYHVGKTEKCLKKSIRLIHIFSDEWDKKKEIIKNRLLHIIQKSKDSIYARNCKVVEITNEEKKEFLNKTHIQGNDKSSIMLGLKNNNKVVAVMTFGKTRKVLGNKSIEGTYELYRYSSLNVVGGFSKLLKYFVKHYNPDKIITYASRNWTPSEKDNIYVKNGFKFIKYTPPNYSYTKKYVKREHRFNFRKDKLIKLGYDSNKTEREIMFENGYDRIWDTGNLKFEMTF